MADQLPSVEGDGGVQEAAPVVIFKDIAHGGGALDWSTVGGGGGGGGAVTIADGADVAEGAIAAAAYADTTGAATGTLVGLAKGNFVQQAARLGALTETAPATDTASSGLNGRLQRIAQRITSLIALIPTSLDGGLFKVSMSDLRSATGTKSAVASGIASVTILASNAARKGATIQNTDANILYLDLSGGTATAASCTTTLAGWTSGAFPYYEVPFGYSGTITGIWAADGTGSALVTEFA